MRLTAPNRRWVIGVCAVVVLVSTVLFFLSSIAAEPSARELASCANRLAYVDTVITRWATNNGKGYYRGTLDLPSRSDLVNYISSTNLLNCPEGGEYQLGTLNLATICKRHGYARITPLPRPKAEILFSKVRTWLPGSLGGIGVINASVVPCIANLKQIDGAIQQWALENKKSTTNVVLVHGAVEYLKGSQLPTCPQGGKYILKTVRESPECTIIGHTLSLHPHK
jgi:hypothetical protein